MPKGFVPGLILTLIGTVLCALWHFVISKKLKVPEKPAKVLMWAVMAASAAVFAAVYILPVIINLTAKEV